MLTVRLLTHTMETMTLNNTLETFSFSCTNYFNLIAFSENVKCNGFTNIFFYGIVAKFFCKLLWSCLSFCVVINFCFSGVLFFFVTKRKRKSIVPVRLGCFNLGNNTWACFNNRTGSLFAGRIEDASHPNFFPNNTFHGCSIYACKVIGTFFVNSDIVTLSVTKGQSPFATDLFLYGEVPIVNKP